MCDFGMRRIFALSATIITVGNAKLAGDCLDSFGPFTKYERDSRFKDRSSSPAELPGTRRPRTRDLKIISWNLLRLTGAGVADVAALIGRHRPDLLLLQEATEELAELPSRVGGCFFREPMDGRIYGLAVWSPHPLERPRVLPLPVSQVPGRVPPRIAQIVELGEATFANVHLSHGQLLNRWQLQRVANALEGPAAIIGDYNAVGPIKLGGFKDVGPRQPTHSRNNIIAFRLDRCMARGLRCSSARVLARGPSDHHPIRLDLHVQPAILISDGLGAARARQRNLRDRVERWARAMSDAPKRIRVRQTLFETLDLQFRKRKRRIAQWRRRALASKSDAMVQRAAAEEPRLHG